MAEERFNAVDAKLLTGDPPDCTASIPDRPLSQPSQMKLTWNRGRSQLYLDVSEARDLAEWLETALPPSSEDGGTEHE